MKKKIILLTIILVFIIGIIILKSLKLGYDIENNIYDKNNNSQTISLGVPKLSFLKKENDKSYSYKNIRGNKILVKEVKSYLNTLNKLKCNNTTYYYDKKNDFTIIDYSVNNHILYNTISYEVRYGNYCFSEKISEYSEKLGGIKKFHTLNDKISLSENKEFTPILVVSFQDDIDTNKQEFTATLEVRYLTPIPNEWKFVSRKEIEKSIGTYEIKGNKLYYTRTSIENRAEDVNIPEVSIFEIKNKQLILIDNYLSDYDANVILK